MGNRENSGDVIDLKFESRRHSGLKVTDDQRRKTDLSFNSD